MKYTSTQINAMSWVEWAEAMANELNKAGFKKSGIHMNEDRTLERCQTSYTVDKDNPKYFLLGFVEKAKEIDYLKSLGLLNNGRCPMCGKPIIGKPGRFTSRYDYNYHFQVCQNCVQNWKGRRVNSSQSQGCMIALLLFPWYVLKNILSSM